ATDAQQKADAAVEQARNSVEQYGREGDNLARNGSFEHGWEHWGTTAGEVVESEDARSGEHVLAIGQDDADSYPRTNWIATEPGRVYMVEYWAKKLLEGDEPHYLRMYYQERLKDGTEVGAYGLNSEGSGYLAHATDMQEGEWIRLTSYVEVEGESTVEIRFSPHVYRTSSRYHIDNFRAIDITESQQAIAAASEAIQAAQEAHEAAGDAKDRADAAYTAAGSKSTVTYSTSAPSGAANVGDTHRQRDSSGDIIAEWEYTSSGWVKRSVSSEAISNLDVGKLTAGSADIGEAVIGKVWSQLGVFDRLEAREGWIGGVNLKDGAVEASKVNVENLFSDAAVIDKIWADIVRAKMLTAEEAFICGALIKNETIDVSKINVTEKLTAAVAQFLEIEAGMIKANAFEGWTFTGVTFEGAIVRGGALYCERDDVDQFEYIGSDASGDGRRGVTFHTGDNSQTQPFISAVTYSGTNAYAGGLFLAGRERKRNSTGTGVVYLHEGGDFDIQANYGPNHTTGVSAFGGELSMRGYTPENAARSRQKLRAGETSGYSGSAKSVLWTVSLSSPVPYGTQVTTVTQLSGASSQQRASKVGLIASTASQLKPVLAEWT